MPEGGLEGLVRHQVDLPSEEIFQEEFRVPVAVEARAPQLHRQVESTLWSGRFTKIRGPPPEPAWLPDVLVELWRMVYRDSAVLRVFGVYPRPRRLPRRVGLRDGG